MFGIHLNSRFLGRRNSYLYDTMPSYLWIQYVALFTWVFHLLFYNFYYFFSVKAVQRKYINQICIESPLCIRNCSRSWGSIWSSSFLSFSALICRQVFFFFFLFLLLLERKLLWLHNWNNKIVIWVRIVTLDNSSDFCLKVALRKLLECYMAYLLST